VKERVKEKKRRKKRRKKKKKRREVERGCATVSENPSFISVNSVCGALDSNIHILF
jgi:hypothetical protein